MRATLVGCVVIVLVAGCNRAERRSLLQFLEAAAKALGNRYDDQLRGLPEAERRVKVLVLMTRDEVAAVDDYLATLPPLGAKARQAVEGYRVAKAADLALHEGLLSERRFEKTDAEKRQVEKLRAEAQEFLFEIGRMADGR